MSFYHGIDLGAIKDRQLLNALAEMDRQLREQTRLLRSLMETDPKRGRARIVAPLIPRPLSQDPTVQSTFGEQDEIASFNGKIYIRRNTSGEDTASWELV